jgi:hypothetical protein
MFRLVTVQRLPALTLALLAVFGLLVRALPAPSATTETPFASFAVPMCHTGADGQHHQDRPDADCDACLLCMAVHGDHSGTMIVPRSTELPAISVAHLVAHDPVALATPRTGGCVGAWARAPPATT